MIQSNSIQKPGETMPVEAPPQKKLDLACGAVKVEGFLGVDIVQAEGVDVVHDLRQAPWPFEDDSIDEARCSHFFEHLDGPERITFMNELYRVLKKGAGCLFTTPRGFDRQVQDFSHKWPPVVEASYYYFNNDFYKMNKMEHYIPLHGIKCDFEIRPMQCSVTPEFALKSEEHKLFAMRNYTNAAVDLIVLVVKR
jgi:SAM-dependent methyltransferase